MKKKNIETRNRLNKMAKKSRQLWKIIGRKVINRSKLFKSKYTSEESASLSDEINLLAPIVLSCGTITSAESIWWAKYQNDLDEAIDPSYDGPQVAHLIDVYEPMLTIKLNTGETVKMFKSTFEKEYKVLLANLLWHLKRPKIIHTKNKNQNENQN